MKKINQMLFGIISIWIVLSIIFGFFDLEISKFAVNYKESHWAIVGEKYCNKIDIPLLFLGLTILIGSVFNNIKSQQKVGFIMILYSIINLFFIIVTKEGIEVFSALLLVIFLCIFMFLTYNKNWRNYIPIAISLILLIIFLDLIVEIMKFLWGRVRFNNLSSDTEFTEWYIINGNGLDHDHKSFPSGHAATGWSFLPFLFLLKDKQIKRRNKFIIVIFVIGYGLFTAISRVLAGEHYASDVLFSTGIASLIIIFIYKLLINLDLNMEKVDQNLSNKTITIKHSDLINQWFVSYVKRNGKKIFFWFATNKDLINFLISSNLIKD
ncbi:MAG: phosphatase PAP2 family protein [Promethearchaeota archaeon]